MTNYDRLLETYRQQVLKAVRHLAFSYQRVLSHSTRLEDLDDSQLADWESFVSRFSRTSDLFLAKFVRTFVLKGDPAFRGSLRDFLDQAEKLGLVDKAEAWMEIREIRNTSAHEYAEERLGEHFEKVRQAAGLLLDLPKRLNP